MTWANKTAITWLTFCFISWSINCLSLSIVSPWSNAYLPYASDIPCTTVILILICIKSCWIGWKRKLCNINLSLELIMIRTYDEFISFNNGIVRTIWENYSIPLFFSTLLRFLIFYWPRSIFVQDITHGRSNNFLFFQLKLEFLQMSLTHKVSLTFSVHGIVQMQST
jgi:hypothetical protein